VRKSIIPIKYMWELSGDVADHELLFEVISLSIFPSPIGTLWIPINRE